MLIVHVTIPGCTFLGFVGPKCLDELSCSLTCMCLFFWIGFHHHTIESLVRHSLAGRYPKLKDVVLDEDNITLALNEEYVTGTTPLKQGDVVALIPPISGG